MQNNPSFILFIREITSPRSVQAVLCLLFGGVACALALQGKPQPELLGWALASIVTYYFADQNRDTNTPPPPTSPPPVSPLPIVAQQVDSPTESGHARVSVTSMLPALVGMVGLGSLVLGGMR